MSVFCELKSHRSIEAIHHERHLIQLELRNPNEEAEVMKWSVEMPVEVLNVSPETRLTGTATLPPGTKEMVERWRVDVSKIPDQLRRSVLQNCFVKAKVGVSPLGAEDFCSVRVAG